MWVNGKAYGKSSMANLRYCGKIASWEGVPLYPADPVEALECEEVIDLIEDARTPLMKAAGSGKEAMAALLAEGGEAAAKWALIDKRLEGMASCTGKALSIADLYLFTMTAYLVQPIAPLAGPIAEAMPDDALSQCAPRSRLT